MPLGNYVIFDENVPERMHFSAHEKKVKDITDSQTGRARPVNAVDFTIDRLNGAPVQSTLSVIQENLFGQLEAYLPDRKYLQYEFTITKRGTGYRTRWTVEAIPLTPSPAARR